jgi:hypothetical protein
MQLQSLPSLIVIEDERDFDIYTPLSSEERGLGGEVSGIPRELKICLQISLLQRTRREDYSFIFF